MSQPAADPELQQPFVKKGDTFSIHDVDIDEWREVTLISDGYYRPEGVDRGWYAMVTIDGGEEEIELGWMGLAPTPDYDT